MPQIRPEKQFNTFAIVGLIAAVCGLPLELLPWKPQGWSHAAGLFFALLATVSGIAACHLALAEIGKYPEQYKDRSLALAGLLIGYLSITVHIVMTLSSGGIQS